MPLEGQWQRQNTPLRRLANRERRLLAVVVALAVLAAAVAVAAGLLSSPARLAPGCVQYTTATATGAAMVHTCGLDAAQLCRMARSRSEALAQTVHEPCRRAGYP